MTTDLVILACVIWGCICSVGLTAHYIHYEHRRIDRYSKKRRLQAEEFWNKRRREDDVWWDNHHAKTRALQEQMDEIWDALRKELKRWQPPDVHESSADEEPN